MPEWMSDRKPLDKRTLEDPYGNGLAARPGRELDAAIAEKLFGWTDCGEHQQWYLCEDGTAEEDGTEWMGQRPPQQRTNPEQYSYIRKYSTDVAAAFTVFDWIRSQRDVVTLTYDSRARQWEIDACDYIDYDTGKRDDGSAPRGCAVIQSADTAPLAICRAALKLATSNRRAPAGETP